MIGKCWRSLKVKELGTVITGQTPPTKDRHNYGKGYPFVKPTDLSENIRSITATETEITDIGLATVPGRLIPPRSTCVVCIGSIGKKIGLTSLPSVTNQAINSVVVDPFSHDPFYVYYLLRNALPYVKRLDSGTTSGRENVSKSSFENIEVRTPPITIERKIASILSAYDDLIENNLQRIEILEEMAHNLYREWFVKFRFPGHQHASFVDSALGRIPTGWEVSTLGEHLTALESGKRPKGGAQDVTSGIPSVGAENVFGMGGHNYQSEKYVPRDFFTGMRSGIVRDRDIGLYKDGAYIGRSTYFRDDFPHAEFCVNEHVFLLRATGTRLTQNILYLWMQEPATVSAIRATNANAAQPGINQKGVKGLPIIIPPADIVKRLDDLTEPILALIIHLAKKNESLRRSRDLLLPRLISGEVDIAHMVTDRLLEQ
jgi:type I restriction enzyme S subunit